MTAELGAHPSDGRPLLHVESQAEWRDWLERNHDASDGVWLVSWKKASGKPFIPYPDSVDVALCFGWVDSRPNRLDDARAMRLFTPRRARSPWSRINKAKVARLTEQGRMAPAGLRLVESAKANGSWTAYDEIEDLIVPTDLVAALAANEPAATCFESFPDSSKKNILWWIKSARKPRPGPGASPRRSRWRPRIAWPTIPRAAIRPKAALGLARIRWSRDDCLPTHGSYSGMTTRRPGLLRLVRAFVLSVLAALALSACGENTPTARVSGAGDLRPLPCRRLPHRRNPYPPRRRRPSRQQRQLRPQPPSRPRRRPRPL